MVYNIIDTVLKILLALQAMKISQVGILIENILMCLTVRSTSVYTATLGDRLVRRSSRISSFSTLQANY